jgi:hypothetical protein
MTTAKWRGASPTTQLGTNERAEPTAPFKGRRALNDKIAPTMPTARHAQLIIAMLPRRKL